MDFDAHVLGVGDVRRAADGAALGVEHGGFEIRLAEEGAAGRARADVELVAVVPVLGWNSARVFERLDDEELGGRVAEVFVSNDVFGNVRFGFCGRLELDEVESVFAAVLEGDKG